MKKLLAVGLFLLSGCASAGGTTGGFGSVWYKNLQTGDVKECGDGFYPGHSIRRYRCGKALIEQGYTEVIKCKDADEGEPCVTNGEIRAAERRERLDK